jgi:hypothetical protein
MQQKYMLQQFVTLRVPEPVAVGKCCDKEPPHLRLPKFASHGVGRHLIDWKPDSIV